jgi:hypothetical protein
VRRDRAAAVGVGRHREQRGDVGQGLLGPAELGQADDAVDAQHAQQARVVELAAAQQPFLDVAQCLLVVADLHQLVRQVAVQHGVEAAPAARAGVAQRLVHVGEGLRRVAVGRVAAGDGVEQHAALLVAEHAQALVAQGQHLRQRVGEAALAPHRARECGTREDRAGTVAGEVEAALGLAQLGRRLGSGGVVQAVQPEREPGPALGVQVERRDRGGGGAFGRRARRGGVDMEQVPGPARGTQGGRRPGTARRACGHGRIMGAPGSGRAGSACRPGRAAGAAPAGRRGPTCCAGTGRRPRTAPR